MQAIQKQLELLRENIEEAGDEIDFESMDFITAFEWVLSGKKVSRRGWDVKDYVCFHKGTLCLYKMEDGLYHPWIITEADTLSYDWQLLHP